MKSFIICIFVVLSPLSASAAMVRAAAVIDSRTIVIEGGATVTLRGVEVPAGEEMAARLYLARLVAGNWIYVDAGDVYRSPDALFVNGEMIRRAWRSSTQMRYLGELNLGPRVGRVLNPSGRVRNPSHIHRRR